MQDSWKVRQEQLTCPNLFQPAQVDDRVFIFNGRFQGEVIEQLFVLGEVTSSIILPIRIFQTLRWPIEQIYQLTIKSYCLFLAF